MTEGKQMGNEILRYVRPFLPRNEEGGCVDLVAKANCFLDGFDWAKGRKNLWVANCIPGIIGIFLVELNPQGQDIDQYTWVVVGDLPPAYLSSIYAKSPWDALDGYLGEMKAWADAVENGRPTDSLIPVDGAPTLANARALKSRLEFLSREILPGLPGGPNETTTSDA
jgi:hypothetical protein